MSETRTIDPVEVICGLKQAVAALECYRDMDLKKKQAERSGNACCQNIVKRSEDCKIKPQLVRDPTGIKSCSKRKEDCLPSRNKQKCQDTVLYPEMRCGILFSRCQCVHRDGLQDTCPLSQCQGQPECLVKPWPVCPPGNLLRKKHPELYPGPPDPC